MRKLNFQIEQEVADLGVKVLTVQMFGMQNSRSNPKFETYLKTELANIKRFWVGKNYKDDPVLKGFRALHSRIGRNNRNYTASPEALLRAFLELGRFPRINTIVDIYNLLSLETRLALGAHDRDKIQGDVSLRLTKGGETFIPLGKTKSVVVPRGEYAYIDTVTNNIICRMEVLQVEPTKITLDTEKIFLIVQGNSNTENNYIEEGAKEVSKLLVKFCSGQVYL